MVTQTACKTLNELAPSYLECVLFHDPPTTPFSSACLIVFSQCSTRTQGRLLSDLPPWALKYPATKYDCGPCLQNTHGKLLAISEGKVYYYYWYYLVSLLVYLFVILPNITYYHLYKGYMNGVMWMDTKYSHFICKVIIWSSGKHLSND